MEIVKAHAMILSEEDPSFPWLRQIEYNGRISYKSEDKITDDSAPKFVKMILHYGHESVIEHVSASVRFIVDRGVTHEIVRHRLASYTQESTRYCNYGKKGGGIRVIQPPFKHPLESFDVWFDCMLHAERGYLRLLELGEPPEIARSVLPTGVKTELIMTANLREWRHFFKLRTAKAAHPQMREVTIPLLRQFQDVFKIIFKDIVSETV
jgi:thymidylate synthase (FAD)